MKRNNLHPEIRLLLRILDQAYERQAWHGPNLKGSSRGLTAAQAFWRPGPGRHNIWEVIAHVAYWKYAVRRRLTGEQRGTFPMKGSNWFRCPNRLGEKSWAAARELLEQTHRRLREAIVGLPPAELHRPYSKKNILRSTLIYGIASHDLYHAGQIQLLKRLQSTE